MALADIINKIESDAAAEAAGILEAAEARVAEIRTSAEATAGEYRESMLAQAKLDAEREASRIVVAAKLAARDETLAARRAIIEEALSAATAGLAELPADRYADLIARRIAAVARGGEALHFGSLEGAKAEAVIGALARIAPDLSIEVASEPAPFERGVVLEGDRVRADLSLETIVQERRDELELVLAEAMFGTEA